MSRRSESGESLHSAAAERNGPVISPSRFDRKPQHGFPVSVTEASVIADLRGDTP
jgi:hypothetical protein